MHPESHQRPHPLEALGGLSAASAVDDHRQHGESLSRAELGPDKQLRGVGVWCLLEVSPGQELDLEDVCPADKPPRAWRATLRPP